MSNFREPPHSIEAEKCVLGGLILDNSSWDEVIKWIYVDDFYDSAHKCIFWAIQKLIDENEPVDLISLAENLSKDKELDEIGGLNYLIELSEYAPQSANVVAYAEIIRERSILRQLINKSNETALFASNKDDAEYLENAKSFINNLCEDKKMPSGDTSFIEDMFYFQYLLDEILESAENVINCTGDEQDHDEMHRDLKKTTKRVRRKLNKYRDKM